MNKDPDEELREMVPLTKEMLRRRMRWARRLSTWFPWSLRLAKVYKTTALQYNSYLRILDLMNNMAAQGAAFSAAADAMVKREEELREEKKNQTLN